MNLYNNFVFVCFLLRFLFCNLFFVWVKKNLKKNPAETKMTLSVLKQDPNTHKKRLKRTLLIRTKTVQIFGVIPFIKLQNGT